MTDVEEQPPSGTGSGQGVPLENYGSGGSMRILYWFIGAAFGLIALVTLFVSCAEWSMRKKDPENTGSKEYLGFACVGGVSVALALFFWSL